MSHTCQPMDIPLQAYCCGDIPNTTIESRIYFRTKQAANNFMRHCKSGDTKKIEAMIKRGSLLTDKRILYDKLAKR